MTKTAKNAKGKSKSATKSKTTTASKPASRKKSTRKKSITTTHKLVWRHVICRVRHTPNYISKGWSHIEIIVLTPKCAPLPITQTGYLSHFLDEEHLATAGGPVAFFLDWIEREARTKQWAKAEFKWRQLELFAQ